MNKKYKFNYKKQKKLFIEKKTKIRVCLTTKGFSKHFREVLNFVHQISVTAIECFSLNNFILFSSISLILATSPINGLISLILIFIGVAIYLLTTHIEFLAYIYLIVYIGAIAILFLFVIMLFNLKLLTIERFYRKSKSFLKKNFYIYMIFGIKFLISSSLNMNKLLKKTNISIKRWFLSTNHKDIGTLYFIFGALSGILKKVKINNKYPHIGLLHRGTEKLIESKTYLDEHHSYVLMVENKNINFRKLNLNFIPLFIPLDIPFNFFHLFKLLLKLLLNLCQYLEITFDLIIKVITWLNLWELLYLLPVYAVIIFFTWLIIDFVWSRMINKCKNLFELLILITTYTLLKWFKVLGYFNSKSLWNLYKIIYYITILLKYYITFKPKVLTDSFWMKDKDDKDDEENTIFTWKNIAIGAGVIITIVVIYNYGHTLVGSISPIVTAISSYFGNEPGSPKSNSGAGNSTRAVTNYPETPTNSRASYPQSRAHYPAPGTYAGATNYPGASTNFPTTSPETAATNAPETPTNSRASYPQSRATYPETPRNSTTNYPEWLSNVAAPTNHKDLIDLVPSVVLGSYKIWLTIKKHPAIEESHSNLKNSPWMQDLIENKESNLKNIPSLWGLEDRLGIDIAILDGISELTTSGKLSNELIQTPIVEKALYNRPEYITHLVEVAIGEAVPEVLNAITDDVSLVIEDPDYFLKNFQKALIRKIKFNVNAMEKDPNIIEPLCGKSYSDTLY